ncbi:MAG TPA: hypothetical protein VLT35_05175 [Methanocella sp.]|nr:hypothetical protein [Methanocella sp.]
MKKILLKIVFILLVVLAAVAASAAAASAMGERPVQAVGTGIAPLPPLPAQSGSPVGGSAGLTPSIPIPPPVTSEQQRVQPVIPAGQLQQPGQIYQGGQVQFIPGEPLANPPQPVPQPYDASLLRGSNNNNQKGGRY